jgi:hypothetical protein
MRGARSAGDRCRTKTPRPEPCTLARAQTRRIGSELCFYAKGRAAVSFAHTVALDDHQSPAALTVARTQPPSELAYPGWQRVRLLVVLSGHLPLNADKGGRRWPCVGVTDDVAELARDMAHGYYSDPKESPFARELTIDEQGKVFVDQLGIWLGDETHQSIIATTVA